MYSGPWFSRFGHGAFVGLLIAFLIVTLVAACAVLGLIVLPVEAAFWLGFALPFPWLTGIARAALLALAWTSRD
jgi:hypothetical protein